MRLVDLDPQWFVKDGKRVGFVFRSPTDRSAWQTCFPEPPSVREQLELFEAQLGEAMVQPCKPTARWSIAGGIETASFETMSVTPSLDGSAGGLWHGHISNGEVR